MQITCGSHVIACMWDWYQCLQDPDLAEQKGKDRDEKERDLNEEG